MTRSRTDDDAGVTFCGMAPAAIEEERLSSLSDREGEWLAPLAMLVPAAEPPHGLFAAIEAQLDGLAAAARRVNVGRDWVERSAGVWMKMLSRERHTGRSIYLLRCEPGAVIASHRHKRDEHVRVLEGELRIGERLLKAGDIETAEAGSIHPEITTATGCLVMIHG